MEWLKKYLNERKKAHLLHILKLPSASSGESSTVRNSVNFLIRSLTPPQAAGNALAVQFNSSSPFCYWSKYRGNKDAGERTNSEIFPAGKGQLF